MLGRFSLFFRWLNISRPTRFSRLFMDECLTKALFLIEAVKKPDTFMTITQFFNKFHYTQKTIKT